MILIVSREEKELIARLRQLGSDASSASGLTAEVVRLKQQISALEIDKSKIEEKHAREDRELRHAIGLEKKRQEVEVEQAKREAALTVREENLASDKKRFEDQIAFNTERFRAMEDFMKQQMAHILDRLPNVKVKLTGEAG